MYLEHVFFFKQSFFLNLKSSLYLFWLHLAAGGILIPLPGLEPVPPALEGGVSPLDHQGSPVSGFLMF